MAERMWAVFWSLCRWWFFGIVLGAVIGGGVGGVAIPIFGALGGTWYGGFVGGLVGLLEAPLVAPAVLFPSSVVVDRIWPGLVGSAGTAALGYVLLIGDQASMVDFEGIAALLGIAAVSGAVAAWFGVAVTRRVRIPLPFVGLGALALGLICAVGSLFADPLSMALLAVPAGDGSIAPSMLGGFVSGGVLGGVLIVFNQLIAEEPPAT